MSNPVVFFDITADGAPLGRIEMTVRGGVEGAEGEEEGEGKKLDGRSNGQRSPSRRPSSNFFSPLPPRSRPLSPSSQCIQNLNSSAPTSSPRRPRTSAPFAPVRAKGGRERSFGSDRSSIVFACFASFSLSLSLSPTLSSSPFTSIPIAKPDHPQARRASARWASPCTSRARASTASSPSEFLCFFCSWIFSSSHAELSSFPQRPPRPACLCALPRFSTTPLSIHISRSKRK